MAQFFAGIASNCCLIVSSAKTKGIKIDNEPSFEGGLPVVMNQ